jgi:hypothetical protein
MERKDDIEVLPHWQAQGDISAHRMCSACRARVMVKNECPFCKEALSSDAFLEFIKEFVQMYTATTKTDPNVSELACVAVALGGVHWRWHDTRCCLLAGRICSPHIHTSCT